MKVHSHFVCRYRCNQYEPQEQISKRRAKYQDNQTELEAIKIAAEDSWEKLKEGIEHTWEALEDSVNPFKSQFK